MPNWTKSDLANYENRRKTPSSKPEPVISNALASERQGSEGDTRGFAVVITSYRTRTVDADALVGKFFVDALRYCGLLSGDENEKLDYKVRQIHVTQKSDERTEIEITPL